MQPAVPTTGVSTEPPRGPLAELLRSLPGVQLIAQHDGFEGIDTRLLFRGWTKSVPAARLLEGHGTEEERTGWLRDAIAALGVTARCYLGVGPGRDWVEIELGGLDWGARLLDLVLHTGAVHNPKLPFVDACLLAAEQDSVLMIRKTEKQMAAFIFRDLHEKHREQMRHREGARARYLHEYRQKLESVYGITVHDVTPSDRALPGGEVLSAEFEDPFDLPDVHENNEREREYRDRWLRQHLRSTAFASPRECFFWQGGTRGGPWWRLSLPARQDWASEVLYAIAGTRAGEQWSRWLRWSEQFLFLSSDTKAVMSWEITEHLFHLHVYPTDVLLERARSRSRLTTWLASQEDVLSLRSARSTVRASDVLRRKWQIATLQGASSGRALDTWLLDCLRRLSPRYEEDLLAPEQRAQFNGSARLSMGRTILPWIHIFWRDTTWLPRLWAELQPDCLFIEARPERWRERCSVDDRSRVLGLRRTAKTHEAFLYTPPKQRGSR